MRGMGDFSFIKNDRKLQTRHRCLHPLKRARSAFRFDVTLPVMTTSHKPLVFLQLH